MARTKRMTVRRGEVTPGVSSNGAPPAGSLEEPHIRALLKRVATGEVTVEQATQALKMLPCEELGFATLDHHRTLRRNFPEVVYCAGKTPAQVASIMEHMAQRSTRLLGTRATPAHAAAVRRVLPEIEYNASARTLALNRAGPASKTGVAILAAGTSDLSVAEEAAVTLAMMGYAAQRIYDVGVAGLQRLLRRVEDIRKARVIVVVAGMDGALPSVVGGLVACPVIAVPTSVGYGASFGGVAALLTMLNSCTPGIGVVNIDNGFGAGYLAGTIADMGDAR